MWLLAAALLTASTSATTSANLPGPVKDFVERRQECDHWMGEEPYDQARRAQIEDAIADLRCQALDQDERKLRQRYAASPEALQALDDTDGTP
jgi:Spy/CpxP family protein refolding chaperone